MQLTQEQVQWIIQSITSLTRQFEQLGMQQDVAQNTILGVARILKVPAGQFAEAMIGGKANGEYEKDVVEAFKKITGRSADGLDSVVAQEIKKDRKKS